MKKMKMLAVLAALAFSATACNGGKSNNPSASNAGGSESAPSNVVSSDQPNPSSGSTSKVPPVTRIEVDAPTRVIEEQNYNLDDYITVVGGRGANDYEVEVKSDDTAWVDGHTLTVIGVGDVQLLITAGAKSARFNTVAMSALAVQYEDAIKDVTNGYTVSEFVDQADGSEKVVPFIYHNPRYCLINGEDWIENKVTTNLVGGGFIELRNDKLYGFNLYNRETNPVVLGTKYGGRLADYVLGLDYDMPASVFTTDYNYKDANGVKHTALKVSRTDGTFSFDSTTNGNYNFIGANFISSLTVSNRSYVPHTLYLYPVVDDNGITNWRLDMQLALASTPNTIAKGYYASLLIQFDEDYYTIDALDNFIDNGALPDTIPFTEIPAAFDKLKTAKNYTLTSEVTICKPGDKTNETNQFDGQNLFLESDMACVTKVDGEKYITTYKGVNYMAAYGKDNAAYQIAVDENGVLGEASAIEGATSLWDLDVVAAHLGTGSECYDKFEVSKKTADGDNTVFSAVGNDVQDFLSFFSYQDAIGRRLKGQFDSLNKQNPDTNFYQFLDFEFIVGPNTLHIEISLSWQTDKTTGDQYYAYMDFDYTNIGTTVVNELDSYLGLVA